MYKLVSCFFQESTVEDLLPSKHKGAFNQSNLGLGLVFDDLEPFIGRLKLESAVETWRPFNASKARD